MANVELRKRSARLIDVARAAGVSRSTVGNVFSRPDLVRLEVRVRVEEAARALGYAGPDPKGSLLRAGRTNAIGVVVADRLGYYFDDPQMRLFMQGTSAVCDEHHASMSLISGFTAEAGVLGVKRALVDGLILHCLDETAQLIELARNRNLPFVVIDFDVGPATSSIRIDDRGGARMAVEHLAGLGHRRFAILSLITREEYRNDPVRYGPIDRDWRDSAHFAVTRERLLGYADGLAAAGIDINAVPIIQSPFKEEEGGRLGAAMLLDGAPDATAIVAMSATLAIAVLNEARRRRIEVPGNLSVVGFDDVPEAAVSDPPLTTVSQPSMKKGRLAAEMLFEGGPPRSEVLPVELIVRGSTAPPPALTSP
jgi:DNA-binding LacI/PurR family transcriptional regulator